jgi:hypothetical protein
MLVDGVEKTGESPAVNGKFVDSTGGCLFYLENIF